jgi:adenylate cyclase
MRAGQEPDEPEPTPEEPEPIPAEPEPNPDDTEPPKPGDPEPATQLNRRTVLAGAAGAAAGLIMGHDAVTGLASPRAQAQDAFGRGAELYRCYTREDNAKARQWFEEAIRLDPSWGRPYANLAATYRQDWNFEWTTQEPEGLREVEQMAYDAAQRAIALDPEQPYGYVQLAYILVYRKGHAEAIHAAQTAIRLGGPDYADGYAVLAQVHTYNGEPAQAVPLMERALQLDTRAPVYYLRQLGQAYYVWGLIAQYQQHDFIRAQGLYQQARAVLERAVRQQFSHRPARLSLAPVYVQLGELDKAQGLFAHWSEMHRHITMSQRRSHAPYAQEWIRQRYIGALRQAGSVTVG